MEKKPKVKVKVEKPSIETECFINDVCAQSNVSVYAMAKSIGMHPNQMYTYTSNKALPNLVTALIIASTLNTTVEKLWKVTINQ